jgi:hypothetical protein
LLGDYGFQECITSPNIQCFVSLFGFSFVSKLKLVKFPILSLREDVKIVRVYILVLVSLKLVIGGYSIS